MIRNPMSRTSMTHLKRFLQVAVVVLAAVSVANAASVKFMADLKASSEVPPKDSAGKGMVSATLDTDTNEFSYHIVFSDMSGPVTAAHFHGPADPGVNAGPQVPIPGASIVSPVDGKATLTPAQAKDLMDGKWYFNLHTAANPSGEVRGQLMKGGMKGM